MTLPETPQTTKSSTRVTRQFAKATINVIHEESQYFEESLDSPKFNPIMITSITKWKDLTKPFTQSHTTVPSLALEDRELAFNNFNSNNVNEWNIDGKTEYNIMHMLQHMTMIFTTYQTAYEGSEEAIANVMVSGFSGQLKGWWDTYLIEDQKSSTLSAVKTNDDDEPILNDDRKTIPDVFNTLIFTIVNHFIGDPSL
ncbi:uncharacterized protein DS421_12g366820 [Arachis hypogaea]|uniref:DUF7746 domain-containing protein n=1 Tax=Arachis hypogaea TaxID=3818 RepID=A0A6B9VCF7_ARAHY|nr:uncharacterized protein DS421_19g656730 [Arachis hypogaea]QHO23819.1 uncharacterized protein DS421_12g366820 [Arachis hypogaea]